MRSTPSKCTGPSTSTGSPWLVVWVPISTSSRAVQVGACTPLVIEPIGTSSSSKPGHRSANMPRLTWPCSWLTPLARWPSRRPMWAMLNLVGSSSAPSASSSSSGHAEAGEVALDERLREPVDAGRHRRVRGEHGAGAHRLQRLGEGQRVGLAELADALDALEAGVALVGVEDLGLRACRSARSRRAAPARRRCRAASPGAAGGPRRRRRAGR